MKITYKGVQQNILKQYFEEVYEAYNVLHPYELILEQKRVKNSTMQAQPKIGLNSLLKGTRKYKIQMGVFIKDSDTALVEEMPPEVLKGWFAHELGHLVDYEAYSNLEMVLFGIKYLYSEKFKKEVEHRADKHAIKHGFGEDIIAAKEFIYSSPLFSEEYRAIIRNYYMPIDEVKRVIQTKA